MAAELLGFGHTVRAFGDVIRGLPQSAPVDRSADGEAPEWDGASLTAFAPDVIVAYDGLSPAAWRSARAASKLDVPLALVEEGFPDHGKTVERLLRAFGARAWGRLVRRQARLVVALDPVASAQARKEGFEEAAIRELPSGVDVHAFRPGLSSALLGRPRAPRHVLLHVGRVEPGRGIETLVDAFAATVGHHEDWALAFAGAGSLRHALRAQCERLGVSAHVHWLGGPRAAELPGLLASATALVVPALDDDVASLKIRRAMACGIPVVASDVERLRGAVRHEETGLVVPSGQPGAWREALARLASDPNRRARWGAEARRVAVETMSWETIATAFEAMLVELCAERAGASGEPAAEGVDAGSAGPERTDAAAEAAPTGPTPRRIDEGATGVA